MPQIKSPRIVVHDISGRSWRLPSSSLIMDRVIGLSFDTLKPRLITFLIVPYRLQKGH